MEHIFNTSGLRLAQDLREGIYSASELVEEYIQKIEAVNPRLNAVVHDRFQLARQEAKQADQKLMQTKQKDELPPYLGVPCTVKESFQLSGMPNSAGLLSREQVIAKEDAVVVGRLRAAGAIPLGVTNTSELCMWMESNNKVYGRTNNPYDQDCIAGGSSGGEGAIIGSGASVFGIGSDVGGSIRMPAFFCGVFGHKPSSRLIPNHGQHPPAKRKARDYLCTGPLCRHAEDLEPLVRIFAGPSSRDGHCEETVLSSVDEVSIKDLEVVTVPDNGRITVSDDLKTRQEDAVRALQKAGARIRTQRLRGFQDSLEIWSTLMSEAAEVPYVDHLRNGRNFNLAREATRLFLGRSEFTVPSLGLVLVEKISAKMTKRSQQMQRAFRQLQSEISQVLKPNTVLLFPSYACPAPKHTQPLYLPIRWQYTAIINVLELPATQVPLGLNSGGKPLGIQVIAHHGADHLTLAVACFLENTFGGWQPPDL